MYIYIYIRTTFVHPPPLGVQYSPRSGFSYDRQVADHEVVPREDATFRKFIASLETSLQQRNAHKRSLTRDPGDPDDAHHLTSKRKANFIAARVLKRLNSGSADDNARKSVIFFRPRFGFCNFSIEIGVPYPKY